MGASESKPSKNNKKAAPSLVPVNKGVAPSKQTATTATTPNRPTEPDHTERILSCCVCFEPALPFISLAPCAHFLCGACAMRVTECPQCKQPIGHRMHMPQVTQSVEAALRELKQPVPAYRPWTTQEPPQPRQTPPTTRAPSAAPVTPVTPVTVPVTPARTPVAAPSSPTPAPSPEDHDTPQGILGGFVVTAFFAYIGYHVAAAVTNVSVGYLRQAGGAVWIGLGLTFAAICLISPKK